MTRRSGVELDEERLALHLGMPGQPVPASQQQQVLPGQRPLPIVREGELVAWVALVPRTQHLVQDGEGRIYQRHGVARRKDESVHEWPPRLAQVPAHRAREEQRQEQMDLGPRPTRMSALAVVERKVDRLVDQLAQELPVFK